MSNTVLVVGGGITGMLSSLLLAQQGIKVLLIEQAPILGGKRAALLCDNSSKKVLPENIISHDDIAHLGQIDSVENIEVLTKANLDSLTGYAGEFCATIKEAARFVTSDCTRCGHCVAVCPEVSPNEFDAGLRYRKAIHGLLPQSIPNYYAIDINSCLNTPPNYLPCQRCVEVCDDKAIHFDMPLIKQRVESVGAVIVTTGFEDSDSTELQQLQEFGYSDHPDIVTLVELQRLLESPGPSGGYAAKPSNEEYPENVLFVIPSINSFSIDVITKQIDTLKSQDVENINVLILDQPMTNDVLKPLEAALTSCNAALTWGAWLDVTGIPDHQMEISFIDFSHNKSRKQVVDLVVLATSIFPADNLEDITTPITIELNDAGYIGTTGTGSTEEGKPPGVATSIPGVFAAGGVTGSWTSSDSFLQAKLAAAACLPFVTLSPSLDIVDKSIANSDASQAWQALSPTEQQSHIEHLLHSLIRLGED